MANHHDIANTFPVTEHQITPDTSSNGLQSARTLEDKLLMLDRAPYLKYFQELQTKQIVTPNLQLAFKWLMEDVFSVDNRYCAVGMIACVLWPAGSWSQSRDELFMYLDMPHASNIGQRALVRVNRPAKSPVSTVTLFGQNGRQDFDLGDFSQLYKLLEAVVDSGFTLMQKEKQCLSDALQLMNMPSTCHHGQQPSRYLATMRMCLSTKFPSVEQNWLYAQRHAQNYPVRLRTLVRTIRDRTFMDKDKEGHSRKRPNKSRGSNVFFQPNEPSNLRYELLQCKEIPFHLIAWPKIESVTSPDDLAESLDLEDFITVDGEPGSNYDESLLFVSMNWTALRLIDEHVAPLAKELGRLRVLLSRSCRGADSPFGPTSEQLTDELVGEDDRIHIICRNYVSDRIRIWMLDAGHGRKRWVVRIEKCTEGTRPPLPVSRKRCAPLASKYVLIVPKKPRLE